MNTRIVETQPEHYRMKTAEEIVNHIKNMEVLWLDQYRLDKENASPLNASSSFNTWQVYQTYVSLRCTITGEEYVYQPPS